MRKKVEFNEEIDNVIKSLTEKCYSLDQITEELNNTYNFKCSRSSINKRINEIGIDISSNRARTSKKVSKLNENQVIFYRAMGYSIEDICDKLKIGRNSLAKFIKENDIEEKTKTFQFRQFLWEDKSLVDIRLIPDHIIEGIHSLLKSKLQPNAIVVVDEKPIMIDFYSEKHKIGFVYNNVGTAEHKSNYCDEWARCVDNWIKQINKKNEIVLIPYCYFDSQFAASFIDNVMDDVCSIDDMDLEKIMDDNCRMYAVEQENKEIAETGKLKDPTYRILRSMEDQHNKEIEEEQNKLENDLYYKRMTDFECDNILYDGDFRYIDAETLIPNVNYLNGFTLSDDTKSQIKKMLEDGRIDEYEMLLKKSNNKKYLNDDCNEDEWNYFCGRKVLDILKEMTEFNDLMENLNENQLNA